MSFFTSVEHGEAVDLQVVKDPCGLPTQVLETWRDVLVHREPPDLFHRLVLPQ